MQIIWFTALFPYFVMAILLGRALTLEGAFNGLAYMFSVQPEKLVSLQDSVPDYRLLT